LQSVGFYDRIVRLLVATGALAVCTIALWAQPQPSSGRVADVIVTNAHIYTSAPEGPKWAEAVAIAGEKIVFVGTARDATRWRAPKTRVIDAGGRLVLPGFTDCHIHFLDGSFSLLQINLEDAKDLGEIQRRIRAYAASHPDKPWILGRGWSYPVFGRSGLPDRHMLDEVVADRPVYLEGFDGHTWWANSKALELAGITKATPDPTGGFIVRDPRTGEPTGALKEDPADALVRRVIPPPSREEKLNAYRVGLKAANRFGLVRVHSAGGDLSSADLLEELHKSGELTLRFYLAYRVRPPVVTPEQFNEIERARQKYHDDWISAGAVKFFRDGVIETHTAAMLQPYSDDPSTSGELLWDPMKYQAAVTELDRRGIQIFTHAIGDRAIRTALDAYEHAAAANHTHDARHRVEHIEDVSAQDIPRFGKLGVIASMQPLHAYPDDDTLKIWAGNVGPERVERAWAWNSIEKLGGHLAFGSDWPVVTLNPWPGVQNALTRQTTEGNPPGGFVPRERLSLASTIKAYTIGAAYAGHREKTEGSLEAGKLADLIIVNQDLFKIEPSEIGKTEVLLTMVGGKIVYQSANWHQASPGPENQ
jgi:predicted amidohydrolase YtcJ